MRLIVFAILSFVVSSVHAQETDSYDDRAFYDDKVVDGALVYLLVLCSTISSVTQLTILQIVQKI